MVDFEQITKGINIKPNKGAFGYASITLLKDGNENILFDTGSYGVRNVIKDLFKKEKIDKLFISHLHFDHCSNLDLFRNSKIYINEKELNNLYENNDDSDLYKPLLKIINEYDVNTFNDEINISNNIKTVLTYGHTVGHSSLEFKQGERRILVAGDAIKSLNDYLNSNEYGNAQNPDEYIKTKENIKNNYDVIIPGHSDIIDKNNLCSSLLQFRFF